MERLVALGTALAFVSVCDTSALPESVGTVVVDDGRVGIGLITGGNFGPGSFSIGTPGSGRPAQMPEYFNKDESDGGHVQLQEPTDNGDQQDNNRPPHRGSASKPNNPGGGHRGNAQPNQAKPRRKQANSGQRGRGGQGGTGGGQINIGTVVLSDKKNNKRNKIKNNNEEQPISTDTDALEAIFNSNCANNCYPSKEFVSDSNGGQGTSIQISSINSGNFGNGALSLNNKNKRPNDANIPKKGTLTNGHTGNLNAGNVDHSNKGHGVNSNGNANAETSHNDDYSSGYHPESNDKPWIWS